MPRIVGAFVAGSPHHVTRRGNHPPNVFFSDDKRRKYLPADTLPPNPSAGRKNATNQATTRRNRVTSPV